MIKPEVLDALVAAGCTAEQIAAAVKADQARSSGAARQARYRARKASLVTLRDASDVTNPSPKEIPPTPPKEITPPHEPIGSVVSVTRAHDLAEFKAELSGLDPERVEAIIKHRRSKHGQLTGLSARLFRRDAEACGLSLPDAVDTCISRNWITVKPEFLEGRQRAPPRKRNYVDVAMDRLNGKTHGSEGIFEFDGDAQRIPAGQQQPRADDGNVRSGLARRFPASNH